MSLVFALGSAASSAVFASARNASLCRCASRAWARAEVSAWTSPECRASSQWSISRRFACVGLGEPSLECVQPFAGVAANPRFPGRFVEEDRRRLELIEDEYQRTEQEDEELHGDLEHGVEHQAEPALAQRRPRKIALDLRLVGTEVGQREEEAPQQAGPERIAAVHVDREVDPVQLA